MRKIIFLEIEKYKNKFGIYGILNVLTGKIYIGKTKQRFQKRYWHHCWKLKKGNHDNPYLQNSYNTHKDYCFVFLVIEEVENPDVLNELEIKYIKLFRQSNRSYNILDGGDGANGRSWSEEEKRAIGERNRVSMLGRKHSDETKEKMSKARKGIIHEQLLTLTREQAFEIKTRLINGDTPSFIAKDINIPYKTINNIISNNSYSFVIVDGWDNFRNNRKTYHRLTPKEHAEIYRLYIKEGKTKKELSEMFNRTDKMIAKILKKQSNILNI